VAIRATDHPPEGLVGRRVATIAWALYGCRTDEPLPGMDGARGLFERDWVCLGDALSTLRAVRFVHEHVAPERIGFRVNTVLGLAEAIEGGLGIGHLPCFIGDARPGLVRLGAIDPAFSADLWLLTHPDLRHSPRVRTLLDALADGIARQRSFIEGAHPVVPTIPDEAPRV
jgi:DNA-binding transcriptional LysR family regulator